jgi:hypothetical protein
VHAFERESPPQHSALIRGRELHVDVEGRRRMRVDASDGLEFPRAAMSEVGAKEQVDDPTRPLT